MMNNITLEAALQHQEFPPIYICTYLLNSCFDKAKVLHKI